LWRWFCLRSKTEWEWRVLCQGQLPGCFPTIFTLYWHIRCLDSYLSIRNSHFKFGIRREREKPVKVGQVKNMLSNKFYLGILKYAGEYYQGSHKTFISKKLFDEVHKQVGKIERPRQKGHNFAFVGLAICGECGAAITAEQHIKKYKNGTGQTFIYYRCTKKLKPCTQKYISDGVHP